MNDAERFAYSAPGELGDATSLLPLLPVTLRLQGHPVAAAGLLDTGATVNVLPYDLGLQLGASWDAQRVPLRLTGNLASHEARALLVEAVVASFAPVRLAFAWTRAEGVPLILGQVNFFMEFDVCFYRSQERFEVRPKRSVSVED